MFVKIISSSSLPAFCLGSWMQHISPSSPSSSILLPLLPAGLSAEDVTEREGACEGERGKPSVEWICALSPPPSLLLPPLLCLLAGCLHPTPACVVPRAQVLALRRGGGTGIWPGGRGTENWTSMSAREQKHGGDKPKGKHTHILLDDNISCWSTYLFWSLWTAVNNVNLELHGCFSEREMNEVCSVITEEVSGVDLCALNHQQHPPSEGWRILLQIGLNDSKRHHKLICL